MATTGMQDVASIFEEVQKLNDEAVHELGDGVSVMVLPSGRTIKSLKPFMDEYADAPDRKRGTARLTTLQSLVDHANRHKDQDSVLFATPDPSSPKLLAVYDYNCRGEAGEPRFGQHRALYECPLSDEWKAWTSTAMMNQEQFAEFIEDRILDVLLPEKAGDSMKEFAVNLGITLATPSQLMTLSRGLKVTVNQQVANAVNLGTGEGQITFIEEHKGEGGAALRVPGGFVIGIPVFQDGDRYQIGVRLRYRAGGGKIHWILQPYRLDIVFKDAFEGSAEKAAEDTSLPLFYGAPENA
jgi:uncharacterized protein YfdQ (DUF2303 family)